MKLVVMLIAFLAVQRLKAQVLILTENGTEQEVVLTPDSEKQLIEKFLEIHDASDIEFNSIDDDRYPFRLKNKYGNWVLYDNSWPNTPIREESAHRWSYDFPVSKTTEICVATSKKGKTLVDLYYDYAGQTLYDELIIETKKVNLPGIVTDSEGNPTEEIATYKVINRILAKQNDKWGALQLIDGGSQIYGVTYPFIYKTQDAVPPVMENVDPQLPYFEAIRKTHGLDILRPTDYGGYTIIGRKASSQKYGLFRGEGDQLEILIPAIYDEVIFHKQSEISIVRKDESFGYYYGGEQIMSPLHKYIEVVNLDYKDGIAVQKQDGKWWLYDLDGSRLVNTSAASVEELIDLWLDR
jgi:hypothetical protein